MAPLTGDYLGNNTCHTPNKSAMDCRSGVTASGIIEVTTTTNGPTASSILSLKK
jgi:hypothetical protein